jgi:Peptidase family M13
VVNATGSFLLGTFLLRAGYPDAHAGAARVSHHRILRWVYDILDLLLTIDPHGPNAFRVDGPFSNMEHFTKAFGCKAGDPMVRPDSLLVQIW